MHDVRQRDKPGVSMIGGPQREWLLQSMKESDADFFFVISTVPFMIPHSGAGGFEVDQANKEEAVLNAGRFLKEGGAGAVKIEGGLEMVDAPDMILPSTSPSGARGK